MVRILVVPERLEDMSRQMAQAASTLHDLNGRLGRALGGLDWEARQQANVEGQVQAARSQAHALAEQAEAMARHLADRARAFYQADAEGSDVLGAVVEAYQREAPSSTWDKLVAIYQQTRKIANLGEWLAPLGAATLLALSMRPGTAYPGEVIINLPDWLRHIRSLREFREMVNLPGHFNHFKVTNLPSHMLRWGVVLSVPVIITSWAGDIGKYQGAKLASAMVTDLALTLAPVGVSAGIAAIVIASGGTAGIALVAGTAASLAFDWAVGHYDVREKIIDGVSQRIQSAGQAVVSSSHKAIKALDQAFESTVHGIVNAFQRLVPVPP